MGVDEKLGDDDREDDEFDHFTNEFPREAVGNDFNRGAAGRGRGLGRGHRRMQGNPTVGRHRGQDEGTGRHLGGVKLKLPQFQGGSDPEAYLEWEKRVELIFDCHQYNEITKVRIAVTQFTEYTISWWDQVMITRRRNLEYPIDNWPDLKNLMRRRFVPRHYHRDLTHKLQVLRQGSRSVDEFYKEMETLMTRMDLIEDEENTMA